MGMTSRPEGEQSQAKVAWQGEVLKLFMRNQLLVAPVMPILATLMAMTALGWVPFWTATAWLMAALGCCGVQLYLCKAYFKRERDLSEQNDWIGILAASELFQGMVWVLTLFIFWPNSTSLQNAFLIAAIISVSVVRLLIVSNFMPVLIAGTGVMTIGVAVRCAAGGDTIYLALAGLIITLEVFYLFVARQLQETTRDMVTYRAQKDELITALKAERDRAEEERRKAEEANKAKSTFLANMSHELRTPLNAILGFSEVLERELFGPLANRTYKDYAGDINTSGRYLLGLINDILDLSRIEAGRVELREEPINLVQVMENARHLLGLKAAEKDTLIEIESDAALPKILCDERSINQIAINLLTNAIKFTPSKGRVKLSASRQQDGSVCIRVTDSGPGIPAEEIDRVMSAFSRGSLATKKAIDGVGLGLPIVKGLMELHDGTLQIISTLGRGTEVACVFPASRVLSGPRNSIMASPLVATDSQRKLISMTA
ncbi:MAG: HAMP domain-containing histidine kinase [Proteobacteria bacterium]|nr:HAMP domain-containing histidine kinase [Pseudomonadota bacterium]